MSHNEKVLIRIKDMVSSDLALRDSANDFFNSIESRKEHEITVDFSDIRSISRSFAHQYIIRQQKSEKKISNINIPDNVNKMFDVIKSQEKKTDFLKRESIKFVCF